MKNLLFVWWVQHNGGRAKQKTKTLWVLSMPTPSVAWLTASRTRDELEIKTTAYDTFNHNIRMLNESMGLCIPAMTVRDPS